MPCFLFSRLKSEKTEELEREGLVDCVPDPVGLILVSVLIVVNYVWVEGARRRLKELETYVYVCDLWPEFQLCSVPFCMTPNFIVEVWGTKSWETIKERIKDTRQQFIRNFFLHLDCRVEFQFVACLYTTGVRWWTYFSLLHLKRHIWYFLLPAPLWFMCVCIGSSRFSTSGNAKLFLHVSS